MKKELEEKFFEFQEKLDEIVGDLCRDDRRSSNLRECIECESLYPKKIARLTGEYCVGCYKEIKFGIIPIGSTGIGCGSPHYHQTEDEDPMLHNCIRILEGD